MVPEASYFPRGTARLTNLLQIVDQDCVARAAEMIEVRRSHVNLMRFEGSEDDGYGALKEWIALVLDPATVNDSSGRFSLAPEYLESLADGEHYPLVC